jgi:hypothetical protein
MGLRLRIYGTRHRWLGRHTCPRHWTSFERGRSIAALLSPPNPEKPLSYEQLAARDLTISKVYAYKVVLAPTAQ